MTLSPGEPWTRDVTLIDAHEWAMVTVRVGTPPSATAPNVHCALVVDGVVVARDDGTRGVLCSMRHW